MPASTGPAWNVVPIRTDGMSDMEGRAFDDAEVEDVAPAVEDVAEVEEPR